eukprot:gnl/Chilomastix_caulleri/3927.p1 GENE.gnl/Chilomastix_caulleri/3927~~gnl/Chilomastix_caulleri/3927.p1  ORF type:complete len:85 (-),score=6.25 gnl/Chilomastix_caulleri/3927:58-312(-)
MRSCIIPFADEDLLCNIFRFWSLNFLSENKSITNSSTFKNLSTESKIFFWFPLFTICRYKTNTECFSSPCGVYFYCTYFLRVVT